MGVGRLTKGGDILIKAIPRIRHLGIPHRVSTKIRKAILLKAVRRATPVIQDIQISQDIQVKRDIPGNPHNTDILHSSTLKGDLVVIHRKAGANNKFTKACGTRIILEK